LPTLFKKILEQGERFRGKHAGGDLAAMIQAGYHIITLRNGTFPYPPPALVFRKAKNGRKFGNDRRDQAQAR